MKLTDYLAQYLVDLGVKKVFLITGGACAHIVDSIGKNPNISYIVTRHEQAAAMAADAYSRITKNIGVAIATSGPGATNLFSGIGCPFFDSIPVLMISGQVNIWETKGNTGVRQIGFQETEVVDMVRSKTKFAVLVTEPNKIKYYLDKAVYIAKSGRPGPVWLDIPMNVQESEISIDELEEFDPKELNEKSDTTYSCKSIHTKIMDSKRPVIIAGAGIKLGQAENEFFKLINHLKIPVVSTWSGIDILPYDHNQYVGQYGVCGSRAANFAVQNSDLLLVLGSRLDTRQAPNPKTFARNAFKIVVDIDKAELNKKRVIPDIAVNANVRDFLNNLNFISRMMVTKLPDFSTWLSKCKEWKERYPTVLPEYHHQKGSVNAYVFIEALSKKLPLNSIIVTDEGGNLTWTIQGFKIKEGHRLFSAFGDSPMGYALPASIGAALADPSSSIICIDGDGGFQMNIQELQTIRHHNLPIKIFILDNRCYGIIKQFQETYFESRFEASDVETGYSAPDFVKIAEAYEIPTVTIENHSEIDEKLNWVIKANGPVLCNVKLDKGQKIAPRLAPIKNPEGKFIAKPIEDLTPLLPRNEFEANMIIEPLKEDGNKKSSEIN